jgi:sugar-specific transcriptional regulator TrmB
MERLRSFGLSEYASRAYLALLGLGTTEARDVSRLAKIPLAKIYSTLDHLHEKGLVIVIPETPKKYTPIPFTEYVDRLRAVREDEARQLVATREEMATLFPIVGTTQMNDRGGITTIRGRRNVIEKLRDAAAAARAAMLILATPGMVRRFAHLRALVEQAHARGVRVRLLAPATSETIEMLADLRHACELRIRRDEPGQVMHVGLGLFDRSSALFIHFIPDDPSTYNGKDVAVFQDEEALVQTLQSLVESAWAASASFDAALERPQDGARGKA